PLAFVALLLACLLPLGAAANAPVVCPFRMATALPCPACGMTRSFIATADGGLARALAFHPLGPVLFAAAVLFVAMPLLPRALVTLPARVMPAHTALAGAGAIGVAWLIWGTARAGLAPTAWL
ncbi:MAG: DUF2752 domain-containing protein, partial [Tepidiformaceae bacterium]